MTMPTHTKAQGFTLVEVLIALFILAVGILGIIGLMLFAKQNNYDAIQRTTAAMLATDIAERMRVNPQALPSYRVQVEPIPANTAAPTPSCNAAPGCAPAAIAARDLALWYSQIAGAAETAGGNNTGGLLAPSACITNTGTPNQYRIAIAWRGRTALSNPILDPCGSGTGLYDGDNPNEFRRLFVMDVTIDN